MNVRRETEINALYKAMQQVISSTFDIKVPQVNQNSDGVVVLSGRNFIFTYSGALNEKDPANVENIARIRTGIEVSHQLEVPLILNGTALQLPIMKEIARKAADPNVEIIEVNCDRDGQANTKTQIQALMELYKDKLPSSLTCITTGYHALRVSCTLEKHLDSQIGYEVVAMPFAWYPYAVCMAVKGEVARILTYSEKGDIIPTFSLHRPAIRS